MCLWGEEHVVFLQTPFEGRLHVKNIHSPESKQIAIDFQDEIIMVTINKHVLVIGRERSDSEVYMMSFAARGINNE